MLEITEAEQNKEKRMKRNEDSLRDLWYNIKCTNVRLIGVPEEEEKKKGYERIFEIIIGNLPDIGNSHPSTGYSESLKQDKPNEK